MKSEAKRIYNELEMLTHHGIELSQELVLQVASQGTYWYIVFKNTSNFEDSMYELMAEAA